MSEDKDKVKWTLDLIEKLKAAEIGDPGRLDSTKNVIENGKTVSDSDKNYLKSKFDELKQSEKGKQEESADESEITKNLNLIKKLQAAELGNPEKIDSIKSVLENKQPLSAEDSKYLEEKYSQLQKVDDVEGTITKALTIIEKLKEEEIGDSKRLDSIKKILEERGTLSSGDDVYLAEKLKQYRKIKSIDEPKEESSRHTTTKYGRRPPEWKSEGVTVVLSLVLGLFGLPGIGHIYVGLVGKGIAILIGSLILVVIGAATVYFGVGIILLIIYFFIFIWQIFDSRSKCIEFNDYLEEHGKRPW